MYNLKNEFQVGHKVQLLIENGSSIERVDGEVIDTTLRFNELEYVIETKKAVYQVPQYYLSYCNSSEVSNTDGYKSVKEYLPKIGEKVIVYSGNYNIMYLCVSESTLGRDKKHLGLTWYPGGKPMGNSTSWHELPKVNE